MRMIQQNHDCVWRALILVSSEFLNCVFCILWHLKKQQNNTKCFASLQRVKCTNFPQKCKISLCIVSLLIKEEVCSSLSSKDNFIAMCILVLRGVCERLRCPCLCLSLSLASAVCISGNLSSVVHGEDTVNVNCKNLNHSGDLSLTPQKHEPVWDPRYLLLR